MRQSHDGLCGTARTLALFRSISISFCPVPSATFTRRLSTHPPKFILIPDDNLMWLGWQYSLPVPCWARQLLRQAYVCRYTASGYHVYERRDSTIH